MPFTVSGTANTFEAALTIDLVLASDEICTQTIMATSGTGTPGTWEVKLAFAPTTAAADMPVTLRAYELSAADGSPVNVVERRIIVSAKRPPIMLTSPPCGARTVQPGGVLSISGLSTVPEPVVELRDASGTVAFTENLKTDAGAEGYNFLVFVTLPEGTASGYYDLVAFNYSEEGGHVENEFAVQIHVQP